MYSIQLYDDTAQEYGAKISQGLQSPISATERLDGGIDTARFAMHTKLTTPPKQWQKVRLWTQGGEPFPEGGWSAMTLPGSVTEWISTVYGNGRYYVSGNVSGGGSTRFFSSDGMEWNTIAAPNVLAFGAGKFVALLDSAVRYSADLETWTTVSASVGSTPVDKLIYGDGQFIAARRITSSSRRFAYSADGITWSRGGELPITASGIEWTGLAAGNGIIAAMNNTSFYVSKDNGMTWNRKENPAYGSATLLFANGKFYLFYGGTVRITTDFEGWELHTASADSSFFNNITYGGGRFFVARPSMSYWSLDSFAWFAEDIPNASYNAIMHGGDKFIALAGNASGAVLRIEPAPEQPYKDYFVDSCRSDLITRLPGLKVYRWDVELVGLIKVTQKLPMGNLCFSNDVAEDGTVTQKTYAQVLDRLNNQIFTVLEEDRDNVPFRLRITPTNIPFLGEYAPELFFTGNTLFECLERIGQTQDSFPELHFFEPGVYTLSFRKYNDPNAARHTNTALNADVQYHEAENHAEIVDSTVENYLFSDAAYLDGANNSDTSAVYPMIGQYASVDTSEYEVNIEQDNAVVRLPFPVSKIFKIECRAHVWTAGGWGSNDADATNRIKEFDKWKTLPSDFWAGTWWGSNDAKERQGYYQYNSVLISGLKHLSSVLIAGISDPRALMFRIKYEPLISLRLKTQKLYELAPKPIASILNQQANTLDGAEYSKHQQALVDRMSGEYKTPIIKAPIGQQYKKGEYLNGEILTQAEHTYFYKHVESVYTTSAHYNRKSEFVEVDHNLRQWSIPADRVQDRHIHYTEKVFVTMSPNVGFSPAHPAHTLSGWGLNTITEYLAGEETVPPSVAKIAWKTQAEVSSDASDNSIDYALATCKCTPSGKSVIFTWAAADNASMGSRGYYYHIETPGDWKNQAQRQQFVEYNPKAEYLQFVLSNSAPANFQFNPYYTGTGYDNVPVAPGLLEEKTENQRFETTFPLSKKQQFVGDNFPEVDLSANTYGQSRIFRIQKDLRERIIFHYQLDFVGLGSTILGKVFGGVIVFPAAAVWCGLANKTRFQNPRIFFSSNYRYGGNETKPEQDAVEKDIIGRSYSNPRAIFSLSAEQTGITSYVITDQDKNPMFAYNSFALLPTTVPAQIEIEFSPSKNQYTKI